MELYIMGMCIYCYIMCMICSQMYQYCRSYGHRSFLIIKIKIDFDFLLRILGHTSNNNFVLVTTR